MNIIELSKEAGFEVVDGELRLYFDGDKAILKPNLMGTVTDGLKALAALVAAHEREACAQVCAQLMTPWDENTPNHEIIALRNDGMRQCAAAIRARGEK